MGLEEQGRLVKLPCKEAYTESGDTVYLIYDDFERNVKYVN